MLRPHHRFMSIVSLGLAFLAAACGRDSIAPPAATLEPHANDSLQVAAVQQGLAALTALLSPDGGLDQLLSRGADSTLIAQRRHSAEAHRVELQNQLAALKRSGGRTMPAIIELTPGEVPACIWLLNADDCFLDWYTTIHYGGTGTVYQATASLYNHRTETWVQDNGIPIFPTRETQSIGPTSIHTRPFTFVPPDCFSGDHVVKGSTSHRINVGIFGWGLARGEQTSTDTSQCLGRYLTVSVSPSEIAVGATASVSVGRMPAGGCSYSVTSSNDEVASILNPGEGIWTVMGLSDGTVTITATCPDGRRGTTTLRVIAPQPQCYPNCTTGGEEPPEEEQGCHWERDVYIWPDGSASWAGPWQKVCDVEWATMRASGAADSTGSGLTVRLVATRPLINGQPVRLAAIVRKSSGGVATAPSRPLPTMP